MSVDLTVFNGVTANEAGVTGAVGYQTVDVNFETHQRGNNPTNTGTENNLWSHDLDVPNPAPAAQPNSADASHIYDYDLFHTLGYLGKNYLPAFTASAGANPAPVPGGANADWYRGEPSTSAFPWLNWNNRPYISTLELMNVPKSRSSRLLFDWSIGPISGANGPYNSPVSGHGHLLNFFEKAGILPHRLYRFFDFLEVPSPFVGTDLVVDHKTFESPSSGSAPAGSELLHPPFNLISEMRDPGKVNINTVSSPNVWVGILNGRSDPALAQIADSRRGFSAALMLSPSADWPTVFANPFRSAASGGLTASVDALLPPLTLPATRPTRDEIDVTLMRPDDPTTTSSAPLFDFVSTNAYDDSGRNPYFRFQELSRIENLVTTRSNVYAIWVTMGYFEVEPNVVPPPPGNVVYDAAHPDGYRLKQELGADTGEITRHRAFYIYDRTIPVGYQRGKDLNIENGILLKRMIE
jgi:hypothetical protein